ncbi:MAG: carbohydrate ABC transporter permease [Anaerolineae bacterium]|nr:carbohydrate ABC transporter permease [Anaerolineae bacterium]
MAIKRDLASNRVSSSSLSVGRRSIPIARLLNRTLLYLLLLIAVVWSVFPLLWVFITSLKPDTETLAFQQTFLPVQPTLNNYVSLFSVTRFGVWMRNSALMASATTVVVVLLAAMAAYALARFRYKGFNLFSRATLIAYMMPPIILVVPLFLLLFNLGLTNSLLGLFLVYTATRLPFGIWLLRSYFSGISVEIEEAAMVDGATRFQAFHQVVMPQAIPGMISTAIFVFSVTWHEFLFASILIFSSDRQTLSSGVATFLSEDWIYSWGMLMAAGVMVSLPLVIMYMFLQRYLVAGWGAGSVKG